MLCGGREFTAGRGRCGLEARESFFLEMEIYMGSFGDPCSSHLLAVSRP